MSTTTLTEQTVAVAGKPIFVAEADIGAPVASRSVMRGVARITSST
jgi:hypothetical protein